MEIRDEKVLLKVLREEKAKMNGRNIVLSMGIEHKIGADNWIIGTEGISIRLRDAHNINNESKKFIVPDMGATQKDVNRLRKKIEPQILGGD